MVEYAQLPRKEIQIFEIAKLHKFMLNLRAIGSIRFVAEASHLQNVSAGKKLPI